LGKGRISRLYTIIWCAFCHYSGFFSDWREDKVRELVKFGVDDDNDGLIGAAYFMQRLRA
jgi:hypothetical protein